VVDLGLSFNKSRLDLDRKIWLSAHLCWRNSSTWRCNCRDNYSIEQSIDKTFKFETVNINKGQV